MSTQWDNKETFGEWILKEVYFQDGWPSVMRDPRSQTQKKTMTKDDIARIAEEVYGPTKFDDAAFFHLHAFAILVAKEVREQCALECLDPEMIKGGEVFAARIRYGK